MFLCSMGPVFPFPMLDQPQDMEQDQTNTHKAMGEPGLLGTLAAKHARGAFARWATTAHPALSWASSYAEDLEAWMLHQWEQIAEAGVAGQQLQ